VPKLTPKQAADKWSARTTAAVSDYKAGVLRVTESPTAKAAKAAYKMLMNVMEAINSGRWAAALEAVSLEDWKKAASEKGSTRMAAGVQGSVDKQERYYIEAFPQIETLQREIEAMPNLTIEDSFARARHFMLGMHEFKKRRG